VAPNVHLSTLSIADLRRLLDLARAREQSGLAAQIQAELDARRSQPLPAGRPMQLPEEEPLPVAAPRSRGAAAAVGVAALALIAGGLAWGWTNLPHDAGPPQPLPPLRAAAPAPAPIEAPRADAALMTPPPAPEAPVAPEPARAAASAGAPATATARVAAGPANPCYALPTAAERLTCGYPSLAAQERRVQAAYRHALDASQDPIDIGRRQADWRGSVANVADRAQLSAAFEQRIQALQTEADEETSPPF
jgi:hypothetical protein